MLVNVVERGHGKKAGVPGYYIAGKTGTAQVPKKDGKGYEENNNIGSFVGYGPVEDPKFLMLVRVNHPRAVTYAETTAAPAFGEMAQFILNYYNIPPTRK
jgi:cell division protein FtsI/penicillin-binding protein 2